MTKRIPKGWDFAVPSDFKDDMAEYRKRGAKMAARAPNGGNRDARRLQIARQQERFNRRQERDEVMYRRMGIDVREVQR